MDNRDSPCRLGDFAKRIDIDLRTFQRLLSADDQINMIRLGWSPFVQILPPPVVRYLRERFIDGHRSTQIDTDRHA